MRHPLITAVAVPLALSLCGCVEPSAAYQDPQVGRVYPAPGGAPGYPSDGQQGNQSGDPAASGPAQYPTDNSSPYPPQSQYPQTDTQAYGQPAYPSGYAPDGSSQVPQPYPQPYQQSYPQADQQQYPPQYQQSYPQPYQQQYAQPEYAQPYDSDAQVTAYEAPPPLPVYEQPECPGPGYIWTPGYWSYVQGGYYWVPGTWVSPPQPEVYWTPAYWEASGPVFIFHEGYWGPHVGYYGGINYGYGYGGRGYDGGRWESGQFSYNRAVTNVNITYVHNTYNTTVINTTTVNRTSYAGGEGGVHMQPTPAEFAAMHEQHFRPTSEQAQQQWSARSNRNAFASENRGVPAIAATPRPGAFNDSRTIPAHNPAFTPADRDPHSFSQPQQPPQQSRPYYPPAQQQPQSAPRSWQPPAQTPPSSMQARPMPQPQPYQTYQPQQPRPQQPAPVPQQQQPMQQQGAPVMHPPAQAPHPGPQPPHPQNPPRPVQEKKQHPD